MQKHFLSGRGVKIINHTRFLMTYLKLGVV